MSSHPHILLISNITSGSSDSTQAVEVSIVQAGQGSPNQLSLFHPQFTYPIFGEEERIFGYQGLRIIVRFASHDLRSNIEISYDKKFKAVGDTKATDIKQTLEEWIPSGESLVTLVILRCWKTDQLQTLLIALKSLTFIYKMTPQPKTSSLLGNLSSVTPARTVNLRYGAAN